VNGAKVCLDRRCGPSQRWKLLDHQCKLLGAHLDQHLLQSSAAGDRVSGGRPTRHPPPWTKTTTGNGPSPGGWCRSSSSGRKPSRAAYSTPVVTRVSPSDATSLLPAVVQRRDVAVPPERLAHLLRGGQVERPGLPASLGERAERLEEALEAAGADPERLGVVTLGAVGVQRPCGQRSRSRLAAAGDRRGCRWAARGIPARLGKGTRRGGGGATARLNRTTRSDTARRVTARWGGVIVEVEDCLFAGLDFGGASRTACKTPVVVGRSALDWSLCST